MDNSKFSRIMPIVQCTMGMRLVFADSHLLTHENHENWTPRKFPIIQYDSPSCLQDFPVKYTDGLFFSQSWCPIVTASLL